MINWSDGIFIVFNTQACQLSILVGIPVEELDDGRSAKVGETALSNTEDGVFSSKPVDGKVDNETANDSKAPIGYTLTNSHREGTNKVEASVFLPYGDFTMCLWWKILADVSKNLYHILSAEATGL